MPPAPDAIQPQRWGAVHSDGRTYLNLAQLSGQAIGEKFAANPVTGTGSLTIPIATSPGRSVFAPQLKLPYDSGAGNGPFGFGWNLSIPAITRKTDKGLPRYKDAEELDTFIISGAEELVPVLAKDGSQRKPIERTVDGANNRIQ